MQLRQTKAFGMFHHHQRRIGHIHAHLNHRGTDQHGDLARYKFRHHCLLFIGWHTRMQQADLNLGNFCACSLLGGDD